MAQANIEVNKLTVLELLKSGQDRPFLIPEYQRPYSWTEDEIITLFDDIWEFSKDHSQPGGAKSYFLGCVVSYKEDNPDSKKVRQIIDGQQRITSLFLLLRAIFKKLENEENKTAEVTNFIGKIKPALWKENEMTGEVDRSQILLTSEVVSDLGNELLRGILETGETNPNAVDNYSKNYNKFAELYEKKAKDNSFNIFHFINALLNYTILLPIDAEDQETALTIFNTLNNRGLPLSDADIFKSYIYKGLDDERKKIFIKKWKVLEADSEKDKESIQSLFYYHMFYLRAKENDEKTTTPGVRKYFLEKNKNRLTINVIDDLSENLRLWEVINLRESVEGEIWSQNLDIRKILDCLSSYTNEFWKYPVSIFYMQYKKREDFETIFLKFLRKLYVMLLTRFLERPTVSAIKGDVLKLDVQIMNTCHPVFKAGFDEKELEDEETIKAEKARIDGLLIKPHPKVERMMLKLLAYDIKEQEKLLPGSWEIEHIFPQKWDTKYFTFDEKDANEILEHIGNKIPLEKAPNISASNNYFAKKKEKYSNSEIAICKKYSESPLDEWNLNNIIDNDAKICERMKEIFKTWIDEYDYVETEEDCKPKATPEELEMIEQFRKRGLI